MTRSCRRDGGLSSPSISKRLSSCSKLKETEHEYVVTVTLYTLSRSR